MKKSLALSSLVALSFVIALPALAATLQLPTPPPTGAAQGLTGSGIVNIITTGVNYLITISTVIAVGMFIYGGIKYATGSKDASGILKNAAIGLAAILGVGLVINTIAGFIGRGLNLG